LAAKQGAIKVVEFMDKKVTLSKCLIDADDCVLIVIDVQDFFLQKIEKKKSRLLINHISFLIQVASKLRIPIICTAEDIDKHGIITEQLSKHLPEDVKIHNKMIFGLAYDDEIMTAVTRTEKNTAILVGLDTDVCISHSALGLIQKDFNVAIVDDATDCPGIGHGYGLERVSRAGGLIVSVRSLFYEWLRTVQNSRDFWRNNSGLIESLEGIIL
jgi:isochorismate hydrolase